MKKLIRTICETILSWLGPDNRLADDIPLLVAWLPGSLHYCPFCIWVALQYENDRWHCPQCSGQVRAMPTTDTLAMPAPNSDPDLEITLPRQKAMVAPSHSQDEQVRAGDFVRRFHRKFQAGEVSFHGIELQWEDTGELPAIGSWMYPHIR